MVITPETMTQASGERRKLRMLLSSAGRRVGLLRAFRSSAAVCGIDLEIFACDVQPEWSPACLEADFAFAVPSATSDGFIERVLRICKHFQIALLVPTIDTELPMYALARDRFAAIGTVVAVASAPLVAIARDKLATAELLAAASIPTPWTRSLEHFLSSDDMLRWPVIAKPRHGSSSRGIAVLHSRREIEALDVTEPYIVQEMLYGREFTVNLFFDDEGTLRSAVPHERLRVRGGEVEKGVTVRDADLCRLARDLAGVLKGAFGAMCFQAIKTESGLSAIFEINARFGGGYPLAHRAGATFARWLIEQRVCLPRTSNDDWEADLVMLRYDDAVFV